jgi:hypothetical protein
MIREETTRNFRWRGHASSEGGPLLVADLDAYLAWRGGDEVWDDSATFRVHYYGPLVAKLPPLFQPRGADQWHQYQCVTGIDAARTLVRDLRAAAGRLEPDLVMREQKAMTPAQLRTMAAGEVEEWLVAWRDHMEQGADFYVGNERVLHVDAKPDTDYARACEALEGDAAMVTFGPGGSSQGLVWEIEGAGTADIAQGRDSFLLMRSWVDSEGKFQGAARDCALRSTADEQEVATVTFPSGRVAVVWAPVSSSDVTASRSGPIAVPLREAPDTVEPVQLDQPGIVGVGLLLHVTPGTYRVMCGTHEDEEWDCRWARFIGAL